MHTVPVQPQQASPLPLPCSLPSALFDRSSTAEIFLDALAEELVAAHVLRFQQQQMQQQALMQQQAAAQAQQQQQQQQAAAAEGAQPQQAAAQQPEQTAAPAGKDA